MEGTKHILVVDDDEGMVRFLSASLETAGCRVSVATDGQDALKMITEAREKGDAIDLMLLDVQMPGMSGVRLMQALRDRNIVVQVLIMTGFAAGNAAQELKEMGYSNVMVKPFTRDVLLGRIGEILMGA